MPGIDSYTKLMLHCDGVDGSTTFTDDSDQAHTVSAIATAQVDTAQKVFGTASLVCDGNSDYLSVPDSTDWDFGSGDFTIDCRIRFASISGNQGFFTRETNSSSYFYIAWESGANIRFRDYGGTYDSTFAWSPSIDTWYHFAIVRSGSSIKCYIDGTQIGTTQTFSGTFIDRSVPLYLGAFPLASYWLNGWMDEIRVSKGIARWTTNFTPPTSAYAGNQTLDMSDTIAFDENWALQTNPTNLNLNETVVFDDNWQFQTNPTNLSLNDTIKFDDSWSILRKETVHNATKILYHNPIVAITDTNPAKIVFIDISNPSIPTWTGYILNGAQYAKDIVYNSVTGYYYVACANGIVVKVDANTPTTQTIINLADVDDLVTIDSLKTFNLTFASTDNSVGELYKIDERSSSTLSTNFYYLIGLYAPLATDLNWILTSSLNTNFYYLQTNTTSLKTDFKWLPASSDIYISQEDIIVKIDGVQLRDDDLVLDSVIVTHTIGNESKVELTLARNHDNINKTLNGTDSIITNQNTVTVTINGNLEFSGKVSKINCSYSNDIECVKVSAKGTQQESNTKQITLSLPSLNENLSIYDILVQNPVIDNPYIDSGDDNPSYYKGIKVDLGEKITQQQFRGRYIETTLTDSFQGINAEKIDNGTFDYENDMTYFWQVEALNYINAVSWGNPTYKYIGTSLSSVSSDTWYLKGVAYYKQRILDDKVETLGYYTVGSAPYKEISVKNGQLITSKRWEDKADGLYTVQEAGYNYVGNVQDYDHDGQYTTLTKGYAQLVADLEYEKLLNINGQILPKTAVNMTTSLDAYYYYKMKLLTRINIDNTTSVDIFNNNNGFPVSIKTITINIGKMKVMLQTSNSKSTPELEAIDNLYPDEDNYISDSYEALIVEKYKLPSYQHSASGIGYNFLPSKYWKDE